MARQKKRIKECAVISVYVYTNTHASIAMCLPLTGISDIKLKRKSKNKVHNNSSQNSVLETLRFRSIEIFLHIF